MVDCVLRRLPDLEPANDGPLPRFLGALRELPVRFSPSEPVGAP